MTEQVEGGGVGLTTHVTPEHEGPRELPLHVRLVLDPLKRGGQHRDQHVEKQHSAHKKVRWERVVSNCFTKILIYLLKWE